MTRPLHVEDRYYAVHPFGELKGPRALPLLIPLFADDSVNYGVPWTLGEIGGPAAVDALIAALDNRSPDVRVYAIQTLQQLRARKVRPRLRALPARPLCGGLASDPAAAALLVGLGVTELSCTPAAVHDVKAAIRQVDLAACRKLTSAALELASPREVRDLVSASKK